jgi:purine-binding chemotaxis protein CheW
VIAGEQTAGAGTGARELAILFRLGQYTLALPMAAVQSVERPGRFTPVPFAAPWLRGVTAVRGAVVSVVDLGRFAGGERAGDVPGARLLVTHAAGVTAGLLVDGVHQVVPMPDALAPVPLPIGPLAGWWRGALRAGGEVVPVLDVQRLFASPQFHAYQVT